MTAAVIETAVVPVAGLATRMQPIARSVPKEILPLGGRPVIHQVVDELVHAGISHVVFVVGERSQAIEQYFHGIAELDDALDEKGWGRSSDPQWTTLAECSFSYVRQDRPLGIADAVYCADRHVGDEPYVVHMGDSVIHHDRGLLRRMVEAHRSSDADETIGVGWELPHVSSTRAAVEPVQPITDRSRSFTVARVHERSGDGPSMAPYAVGRFILNGPMARPTDATPPSGRFGGLSRLLPATDRASAIGVPLREPEVVLGAGSIDEYIESWRLLLDGPRR